MKRAVLFLFCVGVLSAWAAHAAPTFDACRDTKAQVARKKSGCWRETAASGGTRTIYKVTFKVVDFEGRPIEGAAARLHKFSFTLAGIPIAEGVTDLGGEVALFYDTSNSGRPDSSYVTHSGHIGRLHLPRINRGLRDGQYEDVNYRALPINGLEVFPDGAEMQNRTLIVVMASAPEMEDLMNQAMQRLRSEQVPGVNQRILIHLLADDDAFDAEGQSLAMVCGSKLIRSSAVGMTDPSESCRYVTWGDVIEYGSGR